MDDGQKRMVVEHAWTSIAHDLFDALAQLGFIAMDGAFGAGWLIFLEGAARQAPVGIFDQLPAFRTKPAQMVRATAAMFVAAVQVDHRFDGFRFAYQARMGKIHKIAVSMMAFLVMV